MKRALLMVVLCSLFASAQATLPQFQGVMAGGAASFDWYVDPNNIGGNASDSNNGTSASTPLATLNAVLAQATYDPSQKIGVRSLRGWTQMPDALGSVWAQNAAYPMVTPTYDATGQIVHPAVLYFASGWNGWEYWMAMTPYGPAQSANENPSILVSHDGWSWSVPVGLTNPINGGVPVQGNNADTRLAMGPDGKMYCFWIRIYGTDPLGVVYQSSSDGVTWSAPALAVAGATELSPSVYYNATLGKWQVWTLYNTTPSRIVRYREGATLDTLGAAQRVDLDTFAYPATSGTYVWHYYILALDDTHFRAVFTIGPAQGTVAYNSGTTNYYGESNDGLNWRTTPSWFLSANNDWDSSEIYQSAFLPDGSGSYDIWYGGVGGASWYGGRSKIQFLNPATNIPKSGLQVALSGRQDNLFDYSDSSRNWTMNNATLISTYSTIYPNAYEGPDGTPPMVFSVAGGLAANTIIVSKAGLPIVANKQYQLSAWLRVASGTGKVKIRWNPGVAQIGSECDLDTTWRRFTFAPTTSSGTSASWALITVDGNAMTIEMSGAQYSQGNLVDSVHTVGMKRWANLAITQHGTPVAMVWTGNTAKFNGTTSQVTGLPAKAIAWTVIWSDLAHVYGVDSAGGKYIDGVANGAATEADIRSAGGYNGELSYYCQWNRVLTAGEQATVRTAIKTEVAAWPAAISLP